MLIKPRPLLRNGHIAVLAISSASELERIEAAAQRLRSAGLRVTLADNIGSRWHTYLAGDDQTRLSAINEALRSDEYDAFFFTRGGYGAMRIVERIDFDAVRRNPRPVIGFSDLTALHQALATRVGVGSFHGPMLNSDFFAGLSPAIDEWFWSMLGGEGPLQWPFEEEQIVAQGEAEGILFGGCLSLTTALIGTAYDYWVDGGIWFWEEVGEPTYRIDRMLTHLRLSGRLKTVRGVLIGKLKDCGPEPEQIEWLLRDTFGSLGVPVVREFPFGHFGDNLLMPVGARVRLSTRERSFLIPEPVVLR
jgi:muramoyltetrapeptide carboxypeptidase